MTPRKVGWAVGASLWLAALFAGIAHYRAYASKPGPLAVRPTPATWPSDSSLVRDHEGMTAIMFVHPDCPCTRASLGELEGAVRGTHARILVVLRSADDDVARRIARIPGAVALVDRGDAARFGAATSGYTVVYDAAGALRFAGGITESRGHAGRNVGS